MSLARENNHQEGAKSRPWPLAIALCVVALVLAPSLQDSGFILDDTVNLSRHANDGDVLGEWTTATYAHADPTHTGHVWRPIPASMQHLLASLSGRDSSVPFRMLTIGFHLLNVALAYLFARRLGLTAGIAGVTAALAGTHAIALENASWASCLFDVSMTTTLLLTLLILPSLAGPVRTGAGAVVSGMLATLCKETAVAFAPLIGVWIWHQGTGQTARERVSGAGLAGIGFLGGSIATLVVHDVVTGQAYGAAVHGDQVANYMLAWVQAVGWGFDLPSTAPLTHSFVPLDGTLLARGAVVGSLSLAAAELARRAHPDRSPLGWIALLAWVLPLFPAAIVVVTTGTVSIRFGYAGILIAVPLASAALRFWFGKRGGIELGVAMVIAGFCMSWPAFSRPGAFATESRLWESELGRERTPWALARSGRFDWINEHSPEALAQWKSGIESAPEGLLWVKPRTEWWDYAQASFLSQQPAEALLALDRIAKIAGSPGEFPPLYACLKADALDQLGRHVEAKLVAVDCK